MKAKFFLEFVKNPIKLSTMFPTSSKTARAMTKMARADKAKKIVELGAAHGNVTKEILKIMPKNATLYAIEINKPLYKELLNIKDPRLVPILGDATRMNQLLKKHLTKVDCVISTVPLATIPKNAEKIIANAKKISTGPFVQIQYSRVMDKFFKRHFKEVHIKPCKTKMHPEFIYTCR